MFLKSNFSNLGTKQLEKKLNEIVNNPDLSYSVFRNIELNFNIRYINNEQNILGNLHSTLLDYLEKKIEILLFEQKQEEINKILDFYQMMLVTPDKLTIMKKNPEHYIGIRESIIKFNTIKEKYYNYVSENKIQDSIKK